MGRLARLLGVGRRRWLVVATGLLALLAILLAYGYFDYHRARILGLWERRLSIMANDRQEAIEAWVAERAADAGLLAAIVEGRAAVEPGEGRATLDLAMSAYGYSSGAVMTPDGSVLTSAGKRSEPVLTWARAVNKDMPRVEMVLSDEQAPQVATVSGPQGEARKPLVVLAMPPERSLYAFLERKEALAPSVEALLVRREGDDLVFLSPLRFMEGERPGRHIAFGDTGVAEPARQATRGVDAFHQGVDYRGEPVLAAARPIAGTPWGLVVKVDRGEALAPYYEDLGWVAGLIVAVLMAGGGLVGLRVRSRQVHYLQALHERDARYERLVDTLQEGIIELDVRDTIRFTNPAFRRLLGYAPGELEGQHVAAILPSKERDAVSTRLAERRRGITEQYEVQLQRKDGTTIPVLASATPVTDVQGCYAGSLSGVVDIAERKRAEAKYRAFFEQAPDGIVVADGETGRHLEFNDVACQQLGYSRDEFARLRLRDYHIAEDPKEPDPLSLEGMQEHWHRRKDGEERVVQVSARRLLLEGRPMVQLIYRDVTEARQQQARLMEGEKLAALGAMTAGIAHELNNPVMGLLNFVQYARRRAGDDRRLAGVLQEAEETAERVTRLVRDLLTVARGRRTDNARERIQDAAQRIQALLAYRLTESDATLEVRIPDELPAVAITPDHLHQVLLNLMTNAIDAVEGRQDRQVAVEARVVGDAVALSVSDTGPGITREQRQRMLEPFYTTKQVGRGTGLGLWIVHNLLEEHGGGLDVTSSPGRGSTFTVTLPVVR